MARKRKDIAASEKKSEKQLANEKSERIMNGVAAWCSFYRSNPQRFVKDYEEYINIYTYDYFMVKQRKREIEMQRQIARQREEEERLKKIQEEREKREKEDKISIIDPIVKNGKKNRPGSINMVINENNNVDNENRKEIDSVYGVINNGGHQVIENQPKEMEFDLDYLIDINEFDEESVESKLKKLDNIDVDIIKKYLKEREGDKA